MATVTVNPFSHPFVRWDSGKNQYAESAVYDIATGARRLCYPVDAKELVATGEYSFERPSVAENDAVAQSEAENAAVAAVAAEPAPQKTRGRRGRTPQE